MHGIIAIALAALTWTSTTQFVGDRAFVQDTARVDHRHSASVELVTWEGAPFWSWEAADCGELFAIGEASSKEDAQALALAAIASHQVRRPVRKCWGEK